MRPTTIPYRMADISDDDFLWLACESEFLLGRTALEIELFERLEAAVRAAQWAHTENARLIEALWQGACREANSQRA